MVSGDPGLLDLFIAGVGYLVSIYFEVDSQLLIIIDIYIYICIYIYIKGIIDDYSLDHIWNLIAYHNLYTWYMNRYTYFESIWITSPLRCSRIPTAEIEDNRTTGQQEGISIDAHTHTPLWEVSLMFFFCLREMETLVGHWLDHTKLIPRPFHSSVRWPSCFRRGQHLHGTQRPSCAKAGVGRAIAPPLRMWHQGQKEIGQAGPWNEPY